jgi:hypothetical protein
VAKLYSQRFYAHQGLSGTGPSITVPAGHVYVVRQITMYMSPSVGITRAFFQDGASGAALFAAAATVEHPEWFGFYGALVFDEGSTFHFQVDAFPTDAADVYAGGYDLTKP